MLSAMSVRWCRFVCVAAWNSIEFCCWAARRPWSTRTLYLPSSWLSRHPRRRPPRPSCPWARPHPARAPPSPAPRRIATPCRPAVPRRIPTGTCSAASSFHRRRPSCRPSSPTMRRRGPSSTRGPDWRPRSRADWRWRALPRPAISSRPTERLSLLTNASAYRPLSAFETYGINKILKTVGRCDKQP